MREGPQTIIDQTRASPGGDAVGRDKNTTINMAGRRSQIDGWIERLSEELRDNPAARTFVDNLQYFFQLNPHDEHVGLEAKLAHAGRSAQRHVALRKKEAFSKLLEKWGAYPSAQEIIAYFLSKIEAAFETDILPLLATASPAEIDALTKERLVDPVLSEMGCGPFMLNAVNVSGMVYWLAEQCYIRWHA